MDITNYVLYERSLSGNTTGSCFIVPGVKKVPEYKNGEPTGAIWGYKYFFVSPDLGFEKNEVKIEGDKPLITDEQIKAKGGKVDVVLKNLRGSFYRKGNGYEISIKADGMEVKG